MIKAITITNYLGESIRLPLNDPWETGLIIKNIEGLGPPKADINFTELATSDGGIDNSARVQSRNIVIEFQFTETAKLRTIEEVRLQTYKYFPIKRNVTIQIETDNRICETIGRVESNEPNIFDPNEGCQISILSPSSYFRKSASGLLNVSGVNSMFEFPFCNDSLTENLIVFGEIEEITERIVFYEGDCETGFLIRIYASGPVKGLSITSLIMQKRFRILDDRLEELIGSGIVANDIIEINTTQNKKGIILLRENEEINILNALERPIPWFTLVKGANSFIVEAEDGIVNLNFDFDFDVLYEGV